ncbi:MAG: hypothetical protein KI793_12975 [Rivularia sp. (in: Bacteria)]|nr:hypothetical protein [Rivularia sp. MS3]
MPRFPSHSRARVPRVERSGARLKQVAWGRKLITPNCSLFAVYGTWLIFWQSMI